MKPSAFPARRPMKNIAVPVCSGCSCVLAFASYLAQGGSFLIHPVSFVLCLTRSSKSGFVLLVVAFRQSKALLCNSSRVGDSLGTVSDTARGRCWCYGVELLFNLRCGFSPR
jgi:hypothetical protein